MRVKFLFAKLMSKIQISAIKNSDIHPTAKVYEKCTLNKVNLGKYSYIAKNVHITDAQIGAFCSIGGGSSIGGGVHPIRMVSTSPVFLSGKSAVGNKKFAEINYNPSERVIIGNDVWIGESTYIKSGIKIGDGAIIGASAVVTKDVEPYSVVAGVPAKELYKRFDAETCHKLLKIKWWDWPEEKLEKYGKYFDSPEELIRILEEENQ